MLFNSLSLFHPRLVSKDPSSLERLESKHENRITMSTCAYCNQYYPFQENSFESHLLITCRFSSYNGVAARDVVFCPSTHDIAQRSEKVNSLLKQANASQERIFRAAMISNTMGELTQSESCYDRFKKWVGYLHSLKDESTATQKDVKAAETLKRYGYYGLLNSTIATKNAREEELESSDSDQEEW